MINKRTPGRPKKQINYKVPDLNDLFKSELDDIIMYHYIPNVQSFKKLILILKQYKIENLTFNISSVLQIATKSYQEDVMISINNSCESMYMNKSDKSFSIQIESTTLYKFSSTLNRSHKGIMFYLKSNDYQSILYVKVLLDNIYKTFKLNLSDYKPYIELDSYINDSLTQYDIQKEPFNTSSDRIKIYKVEDTNSIVFESESNKDDISCYVVDSSYDIQGKKKSLIADIETKHIKPMFNVSIKNEIALYIDKNRLDSIRIDNDTMYIVFRYV